MNISRALRNFRTYRTTFNELASLTQREWADIGISRADIPALARQSVR